MNGKIFNLRYNVMKEKMESMYENEVWDLIMLLERSRVIGCKRVYKTKKMLLVILSDIKLNL